MADLRGIGAEERRFIAEWLRVSLKGYRVAEGFADGVPCVCVQVMRPDDCGNGLVCFEVYVSCSYRRKGRREAATREVTAALRALAHVGRYEEWGVYEPTEFAGESSVLAIGHRRMGGQDF